MRVLIASMTALLALGASAEPPESAGAREPAEIATLLRAGIRKNFEGDRAGADAVWRRIRQLDPTHPAAPLYEVSTLYWRQMFDEDDTRYDAAIDAKCREVLRLAGARLEADSDDVAAHYYQGRALIYLARLQGVRQQFLRAGTHGERGREHLERVIELDPGWLDARYPVGLYYYYADRVLTWFKWLRWLPFVPSGDGPTGKRYIRAVAERGTLNRNDARFVLSSISAYHEPADLMQALRLLRELHAEFPGNSLIHFELIEVLFMAGRYRDVIAESGRLERHPGLDHLDQGRRNLAPVWRARAQLHLGAPQQAWATLAAHPESGPELPLWAGAWARLVRGQILDARGDRTRAQVFYRQVTALEEPHHSSRAADLARAGLETPFSLQLLPAATTGP